MNPLNQTTSPQNCLFTVKRNSKEGTWTQTMNSSISFITLTWWDEHPCLYPLWRCGGTGRDSHLQGKSFSCSSLRCVVKEVINPRKPRTPPSRCFRAQSSLLHLLLVYHPPLLKGEASLHLRVSVALHSKEVQLSSNNKNGTIGKLIIDLLGWKANNRFTWLGS